MLKSGLTIVEALHTARESAKGTLKNILGGVIRSVESGHALSVALEEHPKAFSGLIVNVVKAGETSGTLAENLDNAAIQLKKEKELVSKVKSAMIYPIVVLVATFALGMALAFIVLPKITPLFEGLSVELPATTRFLIEFSHFIDNYGFWLFGVIIAFVVFLVWIAKREFSKPFTHYLLINTPIVKGIVRHSNLARFSRALGMLIKSGVTVDESLSITKGVLGNFYFSRAIADIEKNIQSGKSLSDNLKEHGDLFPTMAVNMVRVGK